MDNPNNVPDAWNVLRDRFRRLGSPISRRILITDASTIDAISFSSTCTALFAAIQKHSCLGRVLLLCDTTIEEVYAMFTVSCLCCRSVVPINASLPVELVKQIINMCSSNIIIASYEYRELVESLDIPHAIIYLHGNSIIESPATVSHGCMAPSPEEAYVLCTSGSTGVPKFVVGSVIALVHRLQWQQDAFPTSSSHTFLRRAPTGFIDSISEIYSLLFGCHTMALPSSPHISSILSSLSTFAITHITLVPSQVSLLLQASPPLPALRFLFITGQAFSLSLVCSMQRFYPNVSVVNLYGATETAGDILFYVFPKAWPQAESALCPAGRPIPGNKAYILDADMQVAEEGELFVSGAHLAVGYLNDDTLTSRKFVHNSFDKDSQYHRLYATGDIAKFDEDLNICILGRLDDWVKINGVQINLASVEASLRSVCSQLHTPQIFEAVIVHINDIIVAVVQCTNRFDLETVAAIRCALRDLVHRAEEVPGVVLSMARLPLLMNGKVDRMSVRQHIENHMNEDTLSQVLAMITDGTNGIRDLTLHRLGVDSLKSLEVLYVMCGGTKDDKDKSSKLQSILIDYNLNELMNTPLYCLAQHLRQPSSVQAKKSAKRPRIIETDSFDSLPSIELMWRAHLLKCIDAAPVFVDYEGTPTVLIGSHSGIFSAFHAVSGVVLWSVRIDTRIEVTAAVNAHDNTVCFIDFKGCVHCYSLRGEKKWTYCLPAAAKHPPVVAAVGEGTSSVFYIGCYDHAMYCLCGASGSIVWNVSIGGSIAGRPVEINSNDCHICMIAATTNGIVMCFADAVESQSLETNCGAHLRGRVLWSRQVPGGVFAAPVKLSSGDVVVCTVIGHILCFTSSGEVRWSLQESASIFATPLYWNNRLYIAGREENLICLDPTRTTVIWRSDIHGVSSAVSRIIYENFSYIVIIEVSGRVLLLDESGVIVAQYHLPGSVFSSPVLHGDKLYVGCRDDYFYCLLFCFVRNK